MSALTIEGYPTPEQLNQAWFSIQQQYTDAIGDMELKIYWRLVSEVHTIYINMEIVNKTAPSLLDLLESLYDDDSGLTQQDYTVIMDYIKAAGEALNGITNSEFAFDPQDYETFKGEVRKSVSKAKVLTLQYQQKKSQLDVMKEKSEKGEKPTKEYYIGLLMTLSDGAGYKLTIDSETVYEFCERIRRHQTKAEWPTKKT